MQKKESDKGKSYVFGLKCLQVLLNRFIFIHDKNEKIIFQKKKNLFQILA